MKNSRHEMNTACPRMMYYCFIAYCKSSIKPRGGLFDFGPSRRGGLTERGVIRGGLIKKSSDNDIFGSFSVLLLNILQNQHAILWLQYRNSTQFLCQTILELTCNVCVAK